MSINTFFFFLDKKLSKLFFKYQFQEQALLFYQCSKIMAVFLMILLLQKIMFSNYNEYNIAQSHIFPTRQVTWYLTLFTQPFEL